MTSEIKERIAAINSGIVPEGYKKTKVGIVPVEWGIKTLGQVLKKVSNAVDVEPDTQYQEIGIRSHGKGIFYKEKVSGKKLGNKSVFWIEPDCFVLNIVFAWEQAIGRTTQKEIGMIASHRFPMFKPNGIDLDYLVYFLLTKKGTTILELASPGGAGRNKTLGQDKFLNSKVILPPLPEQQKIAEILSTQDKLIELKQKLIDQKKQQKKWLMQQLFTGKIRLKGFDGEWKKVHFSSLFEAHSRNTDDLEQYPLYSLTIEDGVTAKPEQYERSHLVKKENNYKIVMPNEFVYNPMNIRFGAVARNKMPFPVAVSGYYDIFSAKHQSDNVFFDNYLVSYDMINYYERVSTGSLIEKKRVHFSQFIDFQLRLPDVNERKAIAEILTQQDQEIALLEQELSLQKQKKKALMQLLLTGKVRVKP